MRKKEFRRRWTNYVPVFTVALVLVFSEEFKTREEALSSEQRIKGWSRKKKEAMIRGDWEEVSCLARCSKSFRKP